MDIRAVVMQILMVLLIVAVGAWLRKRQVMSDTVIKGINQVLLRVALPALIVMTTQRDFDEQTIRGFLRVLLMAAILLSLSSILIFCLTKTMPRPRRSVFMAVSCLPNVGFIGIPIVRAAYGEVGVLYLAGYIMAFNILLFTLHMMLFSGDGRFSVKGLMSTGTLSIVASILLLLLRIRLPEPLSSFGNQLAALTTPLSTLMLGARLIESLSWQKLRNTTLWGAVGMRLILFPLLVYAVLSLIGVGGMELGVMVICSALPAASAIQMLAEKYDSDIQLAAQGISLSLLLCVLTVPSLMALLGF